jgi:hypothetical protein
MQLMSFVLLVHFMFNLHHALFKLFNSCSLSSSMFVNLYNLFQIIYLSCSQYYLDGLFIELGVCGPNNYFQIMVGSSRFLLKYLKASNSNLLSF